MAAFLTSQLDYIYFVYGLALVLLGAVCLAMSRDGPLRAPWVLLAAFGFTHGFVDWIQLAVLTTASSPSRELAQTLLLGASFFVLLEFARRTHRVTRGNGPGPWIHAVVTVCVFGLVLVGGTASLRSALRLVVAGPAIFWTAALLGLASLGEAHVNENPGSVRALAWAAAFLAAFGVSSSIVIPATPFLPSNWPTAEALLLLTGVPVPVFRASFIGGAALAIWAYALSLDRRGRLRRKRARTFWLVACAMTAVLLAGWLFTERLGKLHEAELVADAEATSAQILDHLLMEMTGAEDAARVLAGIATRFHVAPSGPGASRMDDAVDVVAGSQAGRVAYVLDGAGVTVAASNRGEPDSFLGKNYSVRPYFRDAMAGFPARFAGVGLTSRAPGFYASQPIRDASGVINGVAVVKKTLVAGSLGPAGVNQPSFLVAPDGRVLLNGSTQLDGRPLWGQVAKVDSKAATPDRAPILDQEVSGSDWVLLGGERHVAVRRLVPGTEWSVVTLKKETTQIVNRFLGIVIALLLSMVIVAYFVALQRQYGTESRLAERHREAEGRARTMARRADTDALTGVLNRAGFNEAFSREFSRARRYRQPLSLVLLDLDHFKNVNDTHGHPAGDKVLEGAARLLETSVREADLVARWGGEEFAVLAPMTDAEGAVRLAEKLRAMMEVTHLGPVGAVTASFGIAEMRPDDTIEAMLHRVDEALYAAKDSGRNQVRCAESSVDVARVTAHDGAKLEVTMAEARRLYDDTGFGPIDAEHHKLSEGLQGFIEKVNGGKVDDAGPALAAVVDAVVAHFTHEEELMADFSYPLLARHQEAHGLFVGDARRFQAELAKSGVTPNFRRWAMGRLPEWFRYHILAHDMGLAQFLNKAGVLGWRGADAAQPRPRRLERLGA